MMDKVEFIQTSGFIFKKDIISSLVYEKLVFALHP